jgi:hypothetical protein
MRYSDAGRRAAVLVCLVVCALTRVLYLASSKVQFNADEASSGITVRRILHGHQYVFYAGQNYGGTLEQYLQAGSYFILRLPPDPLTLRLPLAALNVATCALVYLIGVRVLPTAAHAVIAALLFAVSPWFNVIGGVTSLGFYAAGAFLTAAVVYCALRMMDGSSNQILWAGATGFVGGLALWTDVATIYVLLPVAIWVLPALRQGLRLVAVLAGGFVIGGLPLFGWFVVHHRLPVPPAPVQDSTIPQRLGNLFGPVLREFIGVTYAHADGGLPLAVQILALAGLLALYVLALWRRRRGLRSLLTGRVDGRVPADLLLAVPVVVVVAYAASNSTWYTGTPRYLMIVYPLFVIGLAALIPRLELRLVAAVGVALVLVSATLSWGFFRDLGPTVTNPALAQRDDVMRRVVDRLSSQHEHYVYADYWTAMPLQYIAGDRLDVAVCLGSKRFPDIQAAVAAQSSPVYVSSPLDGGADPVGSALRAHHVSFRQTRIGFVTIYDQIPAGLQPHDIGL